MIVRTDAVVLRAFDYGETSRIATVLTRHHGVIGVLAKGARRPTSRFGATLQPGAYVELVYYFRESRGLQTLKESAHVTRFPGLTADLDHHLADEAFSMELSSRSDDFKEAGRAGREKRPPDFRGT